MRVICKGSIFDDHQEYVILTFENHSELKVVIESLTTMLDNPRQHDEIRIYSASPVDSDRLDLDELARRLDKFKAKNSWPTYVEIPYKK